MNRATELVHDAVTLLQEHGFVPTVSNGGKHIKEPMSSRHLQTRYR